jgi:hypothetical protein
MADQMQDKAQPCFSLVGGTATPQHKDGGFLSPYLSKTPWLLARFSG